MLRIILIFFLLLAPPLIFQAMADVYLAPGIMLRTDTSGKDAIWLKEIIRQLDRYAGTAGLKPSQNDITIICGDVDKTGYTRKNQLFIPGDAMLWQSDFISRRLIYGLLAAHRFNFHYPEDSPGVAEWIANGIDAELHIAETAGKYTSGNRGFFLLAEAMAETGNLPDFAAMARLGRPENPFMRNLLAEQARLLLYLLSNYGRIGELFNLSCSGSEPDCFIHFFPSAGEAQHKLAADAAVLVWNKYQPLAPERAKQEIKDILQIFVPELNEQSAPTGNYIKCSWQQFFELAAGNRPDSKELKNTFAGRFSRIARQLNAKEASICNELARLIRKAGNGEPGLSAKFSSGLDDLFRQLDQRSQVNDFFHSTLDRHIPLNRRFGNIFDALSVTGTVITGAEEKFFQETINFYFY